MDSIFDNLFDEFVQRKPVQREMRKFDLYPLVDVSEDENEIKVEADLPGIKREDIEIDVDRNLLTIKGERKREEKEK